jgi:hypothetical protein
MIRSEHEYIRKLREHAGHAVEYLSGPNRQERERAVCRALLRALGVTFEEGEITAPHPEPVDVVFREARFQVRELLKVGSKRHEEWKLRLQRASLARSMDDAIEPWRGIPTWTGETTPMSLSDLPIAVSGALEAKFRHYGRAGCSGLDALVYADLTLTHSLVVDSTPGDNSRLAEHGWRSVAVVFPPVAVVLYARADAPVFLRHVIGAPLWRWSAPDGLFDP